MPAMVLSKMRSQLGEKYFSSINMKIIPKGCMRIEYQNSLGDYWVDEHGILQIRAVVMPDLMFSYYVLLHEFMEAVRCFKRDIKLKDIEAWDLKHSDHNDPGSIKGAPYYREHMDGLTLERIACMQDGYVWEDYDNAQPL